MDSALSATARERAKAAPWPSSWRGGRGPAHKIEDMAAPLADLHDPAALGRPQARRHRGVSRPRVAAVAGGTAMLTTLLAAPAYAIEPVGPREQTDVMSIGQAILVFVGIPVAIAAVIYLLVLAPSWTRSGRTDLGDGLTTEPFVLGGDGPADRAAISAAEPAVDATSDQTGGTSASW